jgi:translation initiation factor IF-2
MAKKRIHQIAKELDVASADILFLSKELGIEVKTASSGLTPEEEELVVLAFNEKNSVTESTNNDEVEISETVDESTVVESEKQILDDAESMPVEEEEVDIQIIEVSSGATPEELSPLVNIEATQIVGDLMSLGIMQSMNSPLQDSEIEKLLEKYDLIPEIVERVEVKRSEILDLQEFCCTFADYHCDGSC